MTSLKLSILDQTPIRKGSNAYEALKESTELVKLADKLGYTRYWVSEHHNSKTLAGAAPEVLIAHLAGQTSRIRLGSGGVMLPNHSTLKVAENFRLLEALFPGRIDLGLGRAPGGDRLTSSLLNPSNTFNPKEYVQQLSDLQAFLCGESDSISGGKVMAIPDIISQPALWMLTSSGESAYMAAHFGMALSFAQFINPVGGKEAIAAYKERFKPSAQLAEPLASVGVFVFCADTPAKALEMQAMMDYRLLSFEKGRFNEVFSYDEIRNYNYSAEEWRRVIYNRQRMIAGTPEVVKASLIKLAKELDVEEVVISTFAEKQEDRLRSYELLAEAFHLSSK